MVRTWMSGYRILLSCFLLLLFTSVSSQQINRLDSLRSVVREYAHDSISINSQELSLVREYLIEAKKFRSYPDIILAYQRLAAVNYSLGNASKALHYYKLYVMEVEQKASIASSKELFFKNNLYENEISALTDKIEKLEGENKMLLNTQSDFLDNNYWLFIAIKAIVVISIILLIGWLYLRFRKQADKEIEDEDEVSTTSALLTEVIERNQEELLNYQVELDLADILTQEIIIQPERCFEDNKSIRKKFIFYQPRKLSGGNGLFMASSKRNTVVAVFEVPASGAVGGLLSSRVYNLLDDLVNHHSIFSPLLILKQLEVNLGDTFPAGLPFRGGIKIGVCLYDSTEKIISYSAANMDLYIVQKGLSRTLSGLDTSLQSTAKNMDYELKEVAVTKGMNFYLSSNGLRQQQGGQNKKPLGKKAFINTIESLSSQPITNHGTVISKILNDWKGGGEQDADILVFGFGFS